jgi:uncharacterized protein DUF6221
VSTDLTARVAELAASVEGQLALDEATARAAIWDEDAPWPGRWEADGDWALKTYNGWVLAASAAGEFAPGLLPHVARNDPARVLRRVKAVRDLLAEILAEPHRDVEGDGDLSCWQSLIPGESRCDCGRDARVAGLLGIIASEWED